ncbi:MAG: ComEA family DNA-binding protein [Cyanobacteria bacterium J06621_8]
MFKLSQMILRRKISNDPFYRFQSLEEVAIAVELGIKIDVNQATVDDWLRLPGFSIHQGRSLVELVQGGVQLFCLEDIAAVTGLSITQLKLYEGLLIFAYYDRLSPLSPEKINVNLATIAELMTIPELELELAQKLVGDRQQHGNYRDLIALKSRLQLDSNLISQLMHYLKF